MSEHHLGFLPPNGAAAQAVLDNIGDIDAAAVITQPMFDMTGAKDDKGPAADASSPTAAADRAQLQRDIAAIERASAALRRADPAMESWTDAPAQTMQKPRPVWLLIGVLWLSTALVTIGAVFAISALVG
jgi:hypothetical protein